MQRVARDQLSRDQPMKEIAPELGEARVLLGFADDGTPRTRPPLRDITLRHLLTHTAGYSCDLFNAGVARDMDHAGSPSITSRRYESLRALLVFDPGTRWEYGIGIDWAGRLVEIVSGRALEDFIVENLTGPLGMGEPRLLLRDDMQARLVVAPARDAEGNIARLEFEFPTDGDFHMGGGGRYSTASDYLRFVRMLLGGGELEGSRVLNPETVQLMGENAIGDIGVQKFESGNPAMALPVELLPGQVKRWGLSFILNTEDVPGGRGAYSLTGAGVHNTC